MINIKILLQFDSFKIQFNENSVEFHNIKKNFRKLSTFFAILRYFTQKHH